MDLNEEVDVVGFLGVHTKRDEKNGTVTLTQIGLVDRVESSRPLDWECQTGVKLLPLRSHYLEI